MKKVFFPIKFLSEYSGTKQTKMEEELQKVRDIYGSHIKMLENKREEKIGVFKKAENEAQILVKELL